MRSEVALLAMLVCSAASAAPAAAREHAQSTGSVDDEPVLALQ
jgi:hypothetical protein